MPLFPGDSCFPVSKKYDNRVSSELVSEDDQLRVIIRKLSHQLGEADLSFISREDSMNYVKNICEDTEDLKRNEIVNGMRQSDPNPKPAAMNTY